MTIIEMLKTLQGAMTQQAFSDYLGMDPAIISRWLAGEREPSRESILRLMARFPSRRSMILDAYFNDGKKVSGRRRSLPEVDQAA